MATSGDALKSLALRRLPEPMLRLVKKRHYLRKIRRGEFEEEHDLKALPSLVGSGDVVLDVGANFGVYTKTLSELVGSAGHVFAIEPIPPTFEVLRYVVRKCGLANVTPIQAAMSDVRGTATMQVPLYDAGGENFYRATIAPGGLDASLRAFVVRTETIDSLYARTGRRFAFIKCDVEGHELECIEGAAEVIRTCRPAWLIEVSSDPDEPGTDAAKLFTKLGERGYEPYWFDGTSLRRRSPGDRSVNYFFLTSAHLAGMGGVPPARPRDEG